MTKYEIKSLHYFSKQLCRHCDIDSSYTFYYDETNNIRKFHLNNGDFNAPFSSNFVLGGLAYIGEKPDVSDMFSTVGLQANINEVKLKHIATGDFMDCLKSTKLSTFLKYIYDSPLYLHFSSLNLLYFSIVDIVDSAIAGAGDSIKITEGAILSVKNDLYKLCRIEIDKVIELFVKYNYPNVHNAELNKFVAELLDLFKKYQNNPEFQIGLIVLESLFEKALAYGGLPFIVDAKSLMLISGLTDFYLRPVYTFLESKHLFDNEVEVHNTILEYDITFNGNPVTNFSFLDSKDDILIQGSDVIIGLVGKLSKFVNTQSHSQIKQVMTSMTDTQQKNLDLYLDIVMKTENFNPCFFHYSDSIEDHSKNRLMLELRGKV